MLENAKEILKVHINKSQKITVAVSGGMDSMCLLFLVLESGIVSRENICVLNVNHGIRGVASDNDSLFVKEQCERVGVRFIGKVLDIPKLSQKSGKSMETQAREERQRLYFSLLKDKIADKVLLAHHKDDQAETVLMHIFRGSGLSGLVGMKILSGDILRPLLTTARSEIEEYISKNSIPYVTDETNLISDYNRNYLRNELMPQIKKRWKGVDDAISRLSKAAAENEELMDGLTDKSLIYTDEVADRVVKLDIKCLRRDAPSSRYIFEALKLMGLKEDIEQKHVELIRGLANVRNGARIDLTNNITAIKEYDRIALCQKKEKKNFAEEFRTGTFGFGNKQIIIQKTEPNLVPDWLTFDMDKVPKNSIIRNRQNGDIFKPVGNGTKKLKEFLIDKKIPSRIRDQIPCLCCGKEVLLLFGIEVSESIKIDANTTNAARAVVIESN